MPVDEKYRLNHEYRQQVEGGGSLVLGGSGVHEPDPVSLKGPEDLEEHEPFVGEEWGMYEPDILERVYDEKTTEEDMAAAEAIVGAVGDEDDDADGEPDDAEDTDGETDDESDFEEPAESEPSVPDDQDNIDRLPTSDDEEVISEDPDVEEAEETPMHSLEDLDEADVPTVEEVEGYNRDALREVARDLEVWRQIEGTGSNGYRQKKDIKSFLLPLIQEYHEGE